VWLWLVTENFTNGHNRYQLITQARNIFPIDPSFNSSVTSQHLKVYAQSCLSTIAHTLFDLHLSTATNSTVLALIKILTASAIAKMVWQYGSKLAEEERELE
jgi:glucose-6-phosphate isomerase